MKNSESEQPVFAKEMCSRDGNPAAQTLGQNYPFHGIPARSPVADMHVALRAVPREMQAQVLRAARLVSQCSAPTWGKASQTSALGGSNSRYAQRQRLPICIFSMLTCCFFSKKNHPTIPSENAGLTVTLWRDRDWWSF